MHQAHRDTVVDVSGGLVGQKQPWSVDHGARDRNTLLLTAGERRGARVQAFAEPDPAQQFADVTVDLGVAAAVDAQRERNILDGGHVVDQPEVLEHHPDPPAQARQILARRDGDILVEQMDEPARRPQGEIHELQKRRLPRAARSGQKME